MSGFTRHRRSGKSLATFSAFEADLLRSLAGQGPGAESSVSKLLGVRNRQDGAELVVELQGDKLVALDDEFKADVWEMLNTRCLSIAGGTTQILRNVAGERILGLPR